MNAFLQAINAVEKKKGSVPPWNSSPSSPRRTSASPEYSPFFSMLSKVAGSEKWAKGRRSGPETTDDGWVTLPTIPPITVRIHKASSDSRPRLEVKQFRKQPSQEEEHIALLATDIVVSPASSAAAELNWLKATVEAASLQQQQQNTNFEEMAPSVAVANPILSQSQQNNAVPPTAAAALCEEHLLAQMLPQQVTTSALLKHLEQFHLQQQQQQQLQKLQQQQFQASKEELSSPNPVMPPTPEKPHNLLVEDSGLVASAVPGQPAFQSFVFTDQINGMLSNGTAALVIQPQNWQHIF